MTTETAGGRDEPVVVLLEQLPVDLRLVVVALEEREARQLDEVLVARLVLGQQGQVVVELLAALGVTAGVVDTSRPNLMRTSQDIVLQTVKYTDGARTITMTPFGYAPRTAAGSRSAVPQLGADQ